MDWGLGLLGVVLMLADWWLLRIRPPRPDAPSAAKAELPPDPDLGAALSEGEEQLRALSTSAVIAQLEPVIRRAAPLRGVRRAPARGATRLLFADGTVVLVRSQGGPLALLAIRLQHESILLVACRRVGCCAELEFSTGRGPVKALAVGMDQAD